MKAPKRGVLVRQIIGISLDEAGRAYRMERNVPAPKYIKRLFPLINNFETRWDCVTYLADKVPHETPRSACVNCPYQTDYEWHRQKTRRPLTRRPGSGPLKSTMRFAQLAVVPTAI
jgi:hypothetical protein